jgi:hypothetical protein
MALNKRKFNVPEPSSLYTFEREESPSPSTSSSYISESNTPTETHARGRDLSSVWKFFHREKTKSYGHYLAKCLYCAAKWSRGEPVKLEAHLALQCPNVEEHIRQFYLLRVACREEEQSEHSKKKKLNNQHNLTKYFPQKTGCGLYEERINAINIALLKAFVVCGISFSIIENPYFIDLLQTLCPDYEPPSREILAGRLLDQEHSKVIIKREAILRESDNLTIGMLDLII